MLVVVEIPSNVTYTSLYTLTGFSLNKSLIVTNNTSTPAFIVQQQFQPTSLSYQFPVRSGETVIVNGTLDTIWIRGGTGPLVVQELASTIAPFTGIDLPHDVYTNNVEGFRRPKVSSEPSIAAAIFNGFAYTISGSFSIANNTKLALNFSPAADSLIHKATTNSGLPIEVYSAHATGTGDGIFTAANMNLLSVDSTPATGQLFSAATTVGSVLAADITTIEPYVLCGLNFKPAIVVTNNSGATVTVKITLTFEEIGPRASSFGLQASTELFPTTEMSTFG